MACTLLASTKDLIDYMIVKRTAAGCRKGNGTGALYHKVSLTAELENVPAHQAGRL